MIDAVATYERSNDRATCTAVHGSVRAASQQTVAGNFRSYAVIAPYLVQITPDEINVTIDDREVTLLMGSGGPTYV